MKACVLVAVVAWLTATGDAHKAITSKYTYNDDVFPILRAKCSRCHVAGGVAPMSLMTYEDAYPWAESIRAELIAAHMPPWNADEAFGDLKRAHVLSPRELDIVLTWATGGNPKGNPDQQVPAVTLQNDWTMGKPDLVLPLPSEFTLAADKMEDTHEWTLATGTTSPKWVRAADLLPGTPSIVRSATVYVKTGSAVGHRFSTAEASAKAVSGAGAGGGAAAPELETVLARWLPGQDPEPVAPGLAFRLPAGAELGVRVHYKKTWQFEGRPMTDRSTVGVYFATAPSAQAVLTLPVSGTVDPAAPDQKAAFSQPIDQDVQLVALSPDQVPANITVQVEAVRPDGSRTPLIRLNTRANWGRRYWFDKPVALPRGSRVEVVATLQDPDLLSAAFTTPSATTTKAASSPLRFSLNVVPAQPKPTAP